MEKKTRNNPMPLSLMYLYIPGIFQSISISLGATVAPQSSKGRYSERGLSNPRTVD
jgi:hypothetical protein